MIKFSTNPILFKITHINGDQYDTAINASFILGKAFHYAMEVYNGGSDEHAIMNESDAIKAGLSAGVQYIEEYNDGFINYTSTIPTKQKMIEKFVFMFNSYVQEMPYGKEEILETEGQFIEEVDVEWRGQRLHLPIPLKGYTDKIVRDDQGRVVIVDYKTTGQFSNPEKIDGKKLIQAVQYYFGVYAKLGEQPYKMVFEEVKHTKNAKGGAQVKQYEYVYGENELMFDFYLRFYDDVTRGLMGEQVYVPNLDAMYDNEVAIIAYAHRLDVGEERARKMKEHKVKNVTDLLTKEVHLASSMNALFKTLENKAIIGKHIDYSNMERHEQITMKLAEHAILVKYDSVISGHTVDLYRFIPSFGVKMSRLEGFARDIEQATGVKNVRVLAPIPDSSMVGFEIPKKIRTYPDSSTIAPNGYELMIGVDQEGNVEMFDITTAPHMLIAGATGSGKSVFLHSIIKQLLQIDKAQIYLMDPKRVEFGIYEDQVEEYVFDKDYMIASLSRLVDEMEERFIAMRDAKVRDIAELPEYGRIFIVIDEFGDITAGGGITAESANTLVQRIAQMGRAAGVHLIIATQRTSVDVISGSVRNNFPTKVAFRMSKAIDSQILLDQAGAETLLGKGDMLFATDRGVKRLQGFNA